MGRKARLRPTGARESVVRFVAYYRVSTAQQGASGLGLEAQREAVARHVRFAGGAIVAEFEEVESGKKNDRPQIRRALGACRVQRATLIIAKLDRLARNVAFISSLMEAGVDFIACDNPHATRLTIHILAAVAEHEREMISQRTKAALQAAKARGVKLGNPRLQQRPGSRAQALAATAVRSARSQAHATDVLPFIEQARQAGCASLWDIARALTARGIETPAGFTEWNNTQVSRVLAKANRASA